MVSNVKRRAGRTADARSPDLSRPPRGWGGWTDLRGRGPNRSSRTSVLAVSNRRTSHSPSKEWAHSTKSNSSSRLLLINCSAKKIQSGRKHADFVRPQADGHVKCFVLELVGKPFICSNM